MAPRTLLLDHVAWENLGHAVEALRVLHGYHLANPGCELSLVLNGYTPVELAQACPWIKRVYSVFLAWPYAEVPADAFRDIPRDWDYVVTDRGRPGLVDQFSAYYARSAAYFRARIASDARGSNQRIRYRASEQMLLELPAANREKAREYLRPTALKFGILLNSSHEAAHGPSRASWQLIVDRIEAAYPEASLYLFGKLRQTGRSNLSSTRPEDLEYFVSRYERVVNCFDIGLLNQLAVAEQLDAFISPHSGFAFAVQSVGTPWLALSGGRWPEYFWNHVPFCTVIPDPIRYPCYYDGFDQERVDDDGPRAKVASLARFTEQLDEIMAGLDRLVAKRADFEACLRDHNRRMTELFEYASPTERRPRLRVGRRDSEGTPTSRCRGDEA